MRNGDEPGSGGRLSRTLAERVAAGPELSQEFLLRAQGVGGFGSWQISSEPDGSTTWTPEMHRLTGIAIGSLLNHERLAELIEPEDRVALKAEFDGLAQRGGRGEWEVRITRADGESRWLSVAAEADRDIDGTILGFVGTTRDVTAAKEAELRTARAGLHDPLTGLPNRGLFVDRVALAVARTVRSGSRIAVLVLDIDGFTVFNDARGSQLGDTLLKAVADRLSTLVRVTDTVARFGADAYGLVCENVSTGATAAERTQRILSALAQPFALPDGEGLITASVGIAVSDPDSAADSLIRDAQLAMHRAKERGGNAFELFDPQLRQEVHERTGREAALRASLEGGELFLEYQPIMSLDQHRFVGVEALARWRHAERGVVQPNEFIPTAEESGLIVPLGKLVLGLACQQLRQWRDASPEPQPWSMSVNVAAAQLRAEDFPDIVEQALEDAGIEGAALCLELTESVLIEEGIVSEVLARIRRLGVRVSIDDFGTKYSSLSYLTRLSIDELKIDQSFVDGLVGDSSKQTVVSAILAIGESLNMPVTAEGVETEAQLFELHRLGCRTVQGFYFARPLPADVCLRTLLSPPPR